MGNIREEINVDSLQERSEWGFKTVSAIPACGFI